MNSRETIPTSGRVCVSSLVEAALLLGLDRADIAAYRDWCERGPTFQPAVLPRWVGEQRVIEGGAS
jgi:hypothetical protein